MGANGFTSPPKEVVLQIIIAHKNPSLLAGFEPGNLASNGKHSGITPSRTTGCIT
jgi:hypothetical protein